MERFKFSGLPSLSTFTKKEGKTQIFPIIIKMREEIKHVIQSLIRFIAILNTQ